MAPPNCSSNFFPNLHLGGGGTNVCNLTPDDKELDDAIFEIFKKQQINLLKRKYNIQCMNDIIELKKKKISCSNVIDEPEFKAKAHAIFPDLLFGSKLQRSYGQILPSQVQADICKCVYKYSTEALDEQTELMVFSLLDVLCNHFAPKDNVQNCSMNVAIHDSFVTPKVNDATCKQRPPLCNLDLNLDIPTSQLRSKQKENNIDIISDSNIDVQKKSCGKALDRVRGVNYAPDTFSPTPCNDSTIHSKQYVVPSEKNDNAHMDAIHSGDDDNDGNKALLWSIMNSPNVVRKRVATASSSKAIEDVIDLANDDNGGKKNLSFVL